MRLVARQKTQKYGTHDPRVIIPLILIALIALWLFFTREFAGGWLRYALAAMSLLGLIVAYFARFKWREVRYAVTGICLGGVMFAVGMTVNSYIPYLIGAAFLDAGAGIYLYSGWKYKEIRTRYGVARGRMARATVLLYGFCYLLINILTLAQLLSRS